jgi:formate hydrogenlyase subunit 6/NADH:ubiquinone oxidoreductase subunit I
MGYLKNIRDAAVSIFEGMAVTLSWMARRPTTIQYPDRAERPVIETIPERYRGIIEVDVTRCIADLACMRACPIDVISIEIGKAEDGTTRVIKRFSVDASKCMHCGLCTEVCPTDAIRHSKGFEVCARDSRNLVMKYVDEPVVPYKLQKDGNPPGLPHGEPLKKALKKWDEGYDEGK